MEQTILFYVFAALTVCSAAVVVFSRSVIYAAFSLLFTFLGVAGLYVLLSADFIAVAQIMVYIGGILILLVFGVMLTRNATDVEIRAGTLNTLPALAVATAIAAILIVVFTQARDDWMQVRNIPSIEGTSLELGELLLTTYILPFEVAGILLLVAVMGAALIARR
ncbi:MAG: NADH-quinone oxidoreductase subunit J [Ignavibacteria bacterium]|nr:MAG: NADH-quinone oxidoreductase subunit J [Ignavibacteria bacterium]